jgi:TetR/AcrR family transcriptional regulator, repressor for uid operon
MNMERGESSKPVPERAGPGGLGGRLPRTVDWQNPRVVQILDAASRCFGRKGFANTTIQEIAKEAGLTKSMIHYYFENKQALIQELQAFVYERHFTRVEQRLSEMGENVQGRAYEALWETYDIVKDKQFLRLQLELLSEAGRDPAVMKRMGVLQEHSRNLISEAVLDVLGPQGKAMPASPEALSTLIASVLHGLRVLELVEGDQAPTKDAYQLFVALLLLGMKQFAPPEEPAH